MKKLAITASLLLASLANSAYADQVKREDWIDAMKSALPMAFCAPEQYFRQCFQVTAEECEQAAAAATRICLNKNLKDFPAVFNQPDDGSHWGSVVGSCAGEAYEIHLMKKRINNKACNTPENWM
jgi:hypothetical protein